MLKFALVLLNQICLAHQHPFMDILYKDTKSVTLRQVVLQ